MHGDFSFHETGLIGVLSGQHAAWMEHLRETRNGLLVLTETARGTLHTVADGYEDIDHQLAARIDATYPASPRTRRVTPTGE